MFKDGMVSESLVLKASNGSYYIGRLMYYEQTAIWHSLAEDQIDPIYYSCYSDAYSALLLSYQQIVEKLGVVS